MTFCVLLLQQKSIIVQQFLTSLRHIAFHGFSSDFIFTGQSDAWYPALELVSVLPDSVSVNRRLGPSGCASLPASWACALPRNSSQCTERKSNPSRNASHTILRAQVNIADWILTEPNELLTYLKSDIKYSHGRRNIQIDNTNLCNNDFLCLTQAMTTIKTLLLNGRIPGLKQWHTKSK